MIEHSAKSFVSDESKRVRVTARTLTIFVESWAYIV